MPAPTLPAPRADYVWIDGDFVPWNEAQVHVLSHTLHYGTSVFEGIRCYDTEQGPQVFRLRDHIERLFYSAKVMRMEMAFDVDTLIEAALESVRRNGFSSCYLRPLVFRGAGNMGVNPQNNPVHVMIASWMWGAYLGNDAMEKGIDVTVSSWRKFSPDSLPAMAKIGGAYALATLAKMEALRLGFAEALLLDAQGRVAEGTGENLFGVIGGRLITPPVSNSVLEGITRHSVMTFARDAGLELREESMTRGTLYLADELFMTGTAAEITPIKSVDRLPVGDGTVGPITRQLQQSFFKVVNGEGPDRHGWLTAVGVGATPTTPA